VDKLLLTKEKYLNFFMPKENKFLLRTIELSRKGMQQGNGGPFGCVIVKNGEIIGEGCNVVDRET
jgi:guanine deaminase